MSCRVLRRWCSSRSERGARLAVVAVALSLGACSTLGYYAQAVRGQLDVIAASRPLEEVLADPATDPGVRERLRQLPALRNFAVIELHLNDGSSYRSYADLGREAMVWSIVATPADSLEPQQWCYPVLGCASYRGYFDRGAAEAHAADLAAGGWDVAVEPVPAYSTLGWFSDPLPSTVAHWPVARIAGLLFHELAHETLYVRGDSVFNEGYATLIEREGVRRWLLHHGSIEQREENRIQEARRADFLRLVGAARSRLEELYARALPRPRMLDRKAAILAGLRRDYATQKTRWDGYAGYDHWFDRPLNNAHLASVGTYNALLPAFERLLVGVGGDMRRFHAVCRELAGLAPDQRLTRLRRVSAVGMPGSKKRHRRLRRRSCIALSVD